MILLCVYFVLDCPLPFGGFSWPMTLTPTTLHYLVVVFIPLMSFVSEIEAAIKVKGE